MSWKVRTRVLKNLVDSNFINTYHDLGSEAFCVYYLRIFVLAFLFSREEREERMDGWMDYPNSWTYQEFGKKIVDSKIIMGPKLKNTT